MYRLFTILLSLFALAPASAINVGSMTFSLESDARFVSKRVVNNNSGARLYQVSVTQINRPGETEISSRAADGELLFSPRQLTLQAGQSEYYKFYYHGPQDSTERYFRILFREIPTSLLNSVKRKNSDIRLDPVVEMSTILVVRPRNADFRWRYDEQSRQISNPGNTFFRLIIKPTCDSNDEDSASYYMRPGDSLKLEEKDLNYPKLIVYNNKFIPLDKFCR
ncbi:fimbria/pilus periplasmic chaperone [Rahnella bruchi]|uniref:fimbrial biogenesis chaperone n=1 Tax=Rahnella bruchi TaxID=1510573 RepID=UPI000EA18B64|nr:fimbria/pilus periplasmic chaperone [Rahnella bruchi]